MTFELRNAAQTFQRFVDEMLRGLDFCYAYCDDILVTSESEEQHLKHLKQLFERLQEYGVVISPSKCTFGVPEIVFLGFLVSSKGIQPPAEKVQAVREYPRPNTAKQLRRFLGMLNFFRNSLPGAAQEQAPLNDLLSNNVKGKDLIKWTPEAIKQFKQAKESLANAAVLAHPQSNAFLALVCDASDTAVGAVLQQKIHDRWEPLGFFSKKLSPAQKKYSAFDRELLAIYLAVEHFKYMVEARVFTIYTDHKPLIFAFQQRPEKASPRQARHLDLISQYSTDIQHISGKDNVIADALSRIEEVTAPLDYNALALSQEEDEELKSLIQTGSGLRLEKCTMKEARKSIYCDTSTAYPRPFITKPFRKIVFNSMHHLSHPGVKTTVKLITERFVWPGVKADCRAWAQACRECQQSKVTRHMFAPIKEFKTPSARFQHIHVDIIIMPSSEGSRYCLTCVDRFTRWPEAFPMPDQEAETVAKTFYNGWICRFGTPSRITTDQGRQFESHLFQSLNQLTGTAHFRTTAYHPQANGMVERFHRQLKAAIRCHQNNQWTAILPTVLLGIRGAWKEDLKATAAEMVYGETVRLPGEFLTESTSEENNPSNFVEQLRQHFHTLRPAQMTRHGTNKTFIFKDLSSTEYVFVRHDAQRNSLQMPYDGPYKVVKRGPKTFVISINDRQVTVTIDRLKPAYVMKDEGAEQKIAPDLSKRNLEEDQQPRSILKSKEQSQSTRKSGRKVRFTDYYQAGFN